MWECPSSVTLRRERFAAYLKIRFVPGRYAVTRLEAIANLPNWFAGSGFKAAIYADDELTLVCLEERVPDSVMTEKGWACLRTIEPFPFEATGIVQSLVTPLSENGLGVFVICTFDGEHILIPSTDAKKAKHLLEAAGHSLQNEHSK